MTVPSPDPERLPLAYWLSLIYGDFQWYGKRRLWPGLVRSLWATIIDRDNVERCNICGRRYPSWLASDALYERVHGNQHGQLCPACLDAGARNIGIKLVWVATEIDGDYMTGLRAICDEIGAFCDIP